MKNLKLLLASAAIISTFLNCTHKTISMDKMPSTQIIFGNGGGFAGLIKEYALLEDGRVVEKSKDGTAYTRLAKISLEKAEQCFSNAATLNLQNVKFNEPGNMYYFVGVKSAGQDENRIVWGNNNVQVPPGIESLYKILCSYLPKKKTNQPTD
jgi:hypothetical protein